MMPRAATGAAGQAASKLLDRVYVSKTRTKDVLHFPPGTKFYGEPVTGSGKAHVPKPPPGK